MEIKRLKEQHDLEKQQAISQEKEIVLGLKEEAESMKLVSLCFQYFVYQSFY